MLDVWKLVDDYAYRYGRSLDFCIHEQITSPVYNIEIGWDYAKTKENSKKI